MAAAADDNSSVSPGEAGHWTYCPRSWALISLDRYWEENAHTATGTLAHRRVDEPSVREENGVPTAFSLTVWSDTHNLYGVADRVELRPSGRVPVEHKSSRRVQPDHAAQLAAQALCLEDMFGEHVNEGAVWLSKTRRRVAVPIGRAERDAALRAADGIREARTNPHLPPAVADNRCKDCSLRPGCMPHVVVDRKLIDGYHAALFSVPPSLWADYPADNA